MFKNVYNELGLFNAHVLVMLVQFYRNVNKLCLKQANNNNKKKEKRKKKEKKMNINKVEDIILNRW